ncbi:thioredoxin domain-containing protein [Patescibacteria group bacterium]|nr:thioredoxin domain-containing protein [Patescibacteria group bacterium]
MTGFFEKYGTPLAVLVGAVIIAFAFAFGGGMNRPAPVAPGEAMAVDIKDVTTDNSPYIGNANAPVTIAVWYDYQCPFCKQFELNTLPQVYDTYVAEGKVKVVLKDFQFLGDDSDTAALYARAVWDAYPDRFHDWYQAMAENQDEEHGGFGNLDSIVAMTKGIDGIDTDKVAKLMETKKAEYQAAIDADRAEGAAFGINGTPSIIIGTTLLSGAQPFDALKPLIEAELGN